MPLSGRTVFFLAGLAAAAALIRVFVGDLALDSPSDSPGPPPAVELSDVILRRNFSGDLWNFDVRFVTRVRGVGDLAGIEGRRTGLDGSRWTLSSPFGQYVESGDLLSLKDSFGTFEERRESFSWFAPSVVWGGLSADQWAFPGGLEVSGDRYSLRGRRGRASPEGTVFLEEGVMEWRSPESDG